MRREVFVGIDVSKDFLDVGVRPSGERFRVAYDEPGLDALVSRLEPLHPRRIVLEATGKLEARLVAHLQMAGMTPVVVNPRQVRDFAKATGELAKTDGIDAGVLAHFAEAIRPDIRPLPEADLKALAELVTRRRQVQDMRVAEHNRLKRTVSGDVRRRIERHLAFLEQELNDIDDELRRQVEKTPAWQADVELYSTVPGVGRTLATSVVAQLPELGHLSGRKISKLVGIAPLADDSGKRHGARHIWGGRSSVRRSLYLATLVAIRHNPPLRDAYQRLVGTGKPKKVAMVACMRKLIVILNAMRRDRTPWTPDLAAART
jgi:transposase